MPPINANFQSLSRPKAELADKVISGMRNTSTVVIWVDVKKSLVGGVKWWRSENEVVLTEGVGEPKMLGFEWIQWVERRREGEGEILYGKKVEVGEVRELEERMDRLGVGLEGGGGVSQGKMDGEKAPQGEAKSEKVPEE